MDDVTFGRNGRDAERWRLHSVKAINDSAILGRSLMSMSVCSKCCFHFCCADCAGENSFESGTEADNEESERILQSNRQLAADTQSRPVKELFQCSVCSKLFTYSKNLSRHKRIHSGDKACKCDVCGKSFSQLGHLRTHMRTHSGDKPYKCSMCDEAFSRSGNLHRHMRVHLAEKPYNCQTCDKSFSRAEHLQTHMRIHSGDKPYKCYVCDKVFTRSGNLRRHMSVHCGDNLQKCQLWQSI